MKSNIKKHLIITFLLFFINNVYSQYYLVGGCGLDRLAVIDRSGKIYWEYPVENKDCNAAVLTKKGDILFSNRTGAKLINKNKETIWEIKSFPTEEMYTSTELKNGNYLLACCGKPARIMEVDRKGKVLKEIRYNTGVENIHGQFRQISKTKKNTYIIPIMDEGAIHEINDKGELLRKIKVEGNPFQAKILNNGNWLISCGDAHSFIELDPSTEKIIKKVGRNDLEFCTLLFAAETTQMRNGNTLIANWGGHEKHLKAPIVVEIDKNNNKVWSFEGNDVFRYISTISCIKKW